MAKRIGITGGIGAGKSIVSKIIESMGFPVFNSDDYAKHLLDSNEEVKSQIIDVAGADVYQNDKLNRTKLAAAVFNDDKLRSKINEIIHPRVREGYTSFSNMSDAKVVFNEAAILFETGAYKQFDATILVVAPVELRMTRVKQRDGASEEEIKARMDAQWADEKKSELATWIVVNDEKQPLIQQIEKIVQELTN